MNQMKKAVTTITIREVNRLLKAGEILGSVLTPEERQVLHARLRGEAHTYRHRPLTAHTRPVEDRGNEPQGRPS